MKVENIVIPTQKWDLTEILKSVSWKTQEKYNVSFY